MTLVSEWHFILLYKHDDISPKTINNYLIEELNYIKKKHGKGGKECSSYCAQCCSSVKTTQIIDSGQENTFSPLQCPRD